MCLRILKIPWRLCPLLETWHGLWSSMQACIYMYCRYIYIYAKKTCLTITIQRRATLITLPAIIMHSDSFHLWIHDSILFSVHGLNSHRSSSTFSWLTQNQYAWINLSTIPKRWCGWWSNVQVHTMFDAGVEWDALIFGFQDIYHCLQ